jgi:glutathione synthase/RimK-type ligase-like ATP-grasp enzyme
MALLVVSGHGDLHVAALVWAAEAYGTQGMIWSPAPPTGAPGFARFEDGTPPDYRFGARGGAVTPSSVDAVWMRRSSRPNFPQSFSEGDRKAARNELIAFQGGLYELLPRDVLWANPIAARDAANFKIAQLAAAQAVGLSVPATIVTNDAGEARRFVAACAQGGAIYKPFLTYQWHGTERVSYAVTTLVDEADLDDPAQLLWSPGIFQRLVPKACELRVSVFGRTCVSARLFDQDAIDWRTGEMKVEPYVLPAPIEEKVHALMDRLGLTMGMIDFIVTPDGEHVFLEVNEQGQFLWVEDMCPEIGVLDVCARFFAGKSPDFRAEATPSANLALADFVSSPAHAEFTRDYEAFVAAGGVHNTLMIRE